MVVTADKERLLHVACKMGGTVDIHDGFSMRPCHMMRMARDGTSRAGAGALVETSRNPGGPGGLYIRGVDILAEQTALLVGM